MSGLMLCEAVQRYVDAIEQRGSEGTAKQYRSIVRRLALRFAGRKYAGLVTSDLYGFLYGTEGIVVGKASATAATARSGLRSFFRFGELMQWGRAPHVPLPVMVSKKEYVGRSKLRTRLSPAQLQLLVTAAGSSDVGSPMLRGMMATAISTALRISDVRKIQLKDIDFRLSEIFVRIMKTGAEDQIPITLDLQDELERYLSWLEAEEYAPVLYQDMYIFHGWKSVGHHHPSTGRFGLVYRPNAARPISSAWASAKIVDLFERCGIEVQAGEAWHTIRRSVARIYFDSLRSEMSHDHALRETSALLHHKNTRTTEVYLGLDAEIKARNTRLRGQPFILSSSDTRADTNKGAVLGARFRIDA